MEPILFWVIVVPIAIIILVVLGRKVWRQFLPSASSRRSQRRNLSNNRTPIRHSPQANQPESPRMVPKPPPSPPRADEQTWINSSRNTPPSEERTGINPPPIDVSDARTQSGPSQWGNLDDEPTQAKPTHKGNLDDDEPTQIKPSRRGNFSEDRTQMGNNRNHKIDPDDDRTVF
jgi:hypothetical protein